MTSQAMEIVQRRANAAWRRRNEVKIVLWRRAKAPDGAGGKALGAPAPLPEQRFRVAATARQHEMTANTTAGRIQAADWLLVSDVHADVQTGDTFLHAGRWWRVRFVDQNRGWRTSAGVVEHGEGP